MTQINIHDLQAISDVAKWLAEQADDLSADQAVELLTEARKAQEALKWAIEMLEARAIKTIEQPILVGRTAWSKVPSFKKRPDNNLILRVVAETSAAPDENGVIPTPLEAARTATDRMASLYVSPSTVPKVGGVKALGLNMADVTTEEHTKWTLKETELE